MPKSICFEFNNPPLAYACVYAQHCVQNNKGRDIVIAFIYQLHTILSEYQAKHYLLVTRTQSNQYRWVLCIAQLKHFSIQMNIPLTKAIEVEQQAIRAQQFELS